VRRAFGSRRCTMLPRRGHRWYSPSATRSARPEAGQVAISVAMVMPETGSSWSRSGRRFREATVERPEDDDQDAEQERPAKLPGRNGTRPGFPPARGCRAPSRRAGGPSSVAFRARRHPLPPQSEARLLKLEACPSGRKVMKRPRPTRVFFCFFFFFFLTAARTRSRWAVQLGERVCRGVPSIVSRLRRC